MTQKANHHNPQDEAENHTTVDTGGGANIGGDVKANGDVVGRDQKITIEGLYVQGDYIVHPPLESTNISEETVEGEPPYLGLHFFTENESHLFFGRDALTQELIQQLDQLNQSDQH